MTELLYGIVISLVIVISCVSGDGFAESPMGTVLLKMENPVISSGGSKGLSRMLSG